MLHTNTVYHLGRSKFTLEVLPGWLKRKYVKHLLMLSKLSKKIKDKGHHKYRQHNCLMHAELW